MRRAFAFSRDFPESEYMRRRREFREAGQIIGLRSECEWVPSWTLR